MSIIQEREINLKRPELARLAAIAKREDRLSMLNPGNADLVRQEIASIEELLKQNKTGLVSKIERSCHTIRMLFEADDKDVTRAVTNFTDKAYEIARDCENLARKGNRTRILAATAAVGVLGFVALVKSKGNAQTSRIPEAEIIQEAEYRTYTISFEEKVISSRPQDTTTHEKPKSGKDWINLSADKSSLGK